MGEPEPDPSSNAPSDEEPGGDLDTDQLLAEEPDRVDPGPAVEDPRAAQDSRLDEDDLDEDDLDPDGFDDVDDRDTEGVSDRTTRVIAVILALVALAIVGVLIATGGGETGEGDQADSGGEVRPTTAIFGTLDEFDRADASELGRYTSDRTWEPATGQWGVRDGDAAVLESDDFRNHATVGLGQSDGAVQVRVDRLTAGAGVIFRYRGPSNYWAVVAAPNGGTWNLLRVEETDAQVVGNTGVTPVTDGTTVAARFTGEQIEVIINGIVRLTVQDDFLIDEGQVGMTVRGDDATEARFDDFVAALPGNRPLFIGDGAGATTTSIPSTSSTSPNPSTTATVDGG
jgi:hypothetical protein